MARPVRSSTRQPASPADPSGHAPSGREQPEAGAAAARRQVRRWLSVLDSIPDGIEVVDQTGRVEYVNPAFVRITGVPATERLGRQIGDIAPDGELMTVLRTGRPVLMSRGQATGSDVEVVVSARPLTVDGQVTGAVLVIQDVSEVLRLSRELYRSSTMVDNLYDKIGDLTRASYTFADLIGQSPVLTSVIKLARRAAQSDSTVLITGESGTGKELFAHAIHNASRRRAGPFLTVNCAAIPDQLLESEVFGYEKGAFTGAVRRKLGIFELANHGSILLDEIGEMSLPLQAKFLRVLQEQAFHRLGGTAPVRTNVRVIAATNADLQELVGRGRFRSDLYYRLNVVQVHVPPLRDRREDIPALVQHIITKLNRRLGREVVGVTDEVRRALQKYEWPGNIRELENVLERAMNLLAPRDRLIGRELLQSLGVAPTPPPAVDVISPLEEMEMAMIQRALAEYGNSGQGKRRAAAALGISLATLYNKLKKYELASGDEG